MIHMAYVDNHQICTHCRVVSSTSSLCPQVQSCITEVRLQNGCFPRRQRAFLCTCRPVANSNCNPGYKGSMGEYWGVD